MSLYRQFKTDESVEQGGVEIDYGEGVKIKVARAGGANKRYVKCLELMHRKYRKQIQLEILSNDLANQLLIKAYAEGVVIGWEGVTDEAGEPMPFSVENCVKLFTDLPDLFADVKEVAGGAAAFREELDRGDAGN